MTDEPTSGVEAVRRMPEREAEIARIRACLMTGGADREDLASYAQSIVELRAALATPAASPARDTAHRLAECREALEAAQADAAYQRGIAEARARVIERYKNSAALVSPASPSPAPAAVEELVARLRSHVKGGDERHCLAIAMHEREEAATALSTLAADKARIEAERDTLRRSHASAEQALLDVVAERDETDADIFSTESLLAEERRMWFEAEARASALEGEVERLREAQASARRRRQLTLRPIAALSGDTMTEGIIEAVARALCNFDNIDPDWPASHFSQEKVWEERKDQAQAVITAYEAARGDVLVPRHPTTVQKDAGGLVCGSRDIAHEVYNRMIAASQGER